ncbi:HAMP domain-containing sensor histidine kinase [Niallia sp. NCCP-28]|uniref:sensor histidine kinase n=1 Tax=Niallia sp. NCCP-28 TaxID=2934712 RepID=UPI0020820640|nr:HAMP domain-containing sensor histidine kinase [Niallia sp. NCCP-28]GKU83808.1 sporulation kinase B [Niallia sp. NCCP-28]
MERYREINIKYYYHFIKAIIAFMALAIISSHGKSTAEYLFLGALIIVLAIVLFVYPKHETFLMKIFIILLGTIYFYSIFYIYPETWSSFIFICLIPLISILFFDAKLFYFSAVLNGLLYSAISSYIILFESNPAFNYMKTDIIGNAMNFLGSQLLLFFIFWLTLIRIKKQQLYYEQLQQSEKLKTTWQLAAAVAHEIRNPLTVVKGFLQLYESDVSTPSDRKDNYRLMMDELNMAEKVISQFLMVAKPDTGEKSEEIIDVNQELRNIVDLMKSYSYLNDSEFFLELESDCYTCMNIMEFKQLFINIIKNAIEASSHGQTIVIKNREKGKQIWIEVIDRGNGMTKEELRSLGTPFYSLKSKGTGLGMMICYNIVLKYQGTIDINSKKGKGTAVAVKLPSCSRR